MITTASAAEQVCVCLRLIRECPLLLPQTFSLFNNNSVAICSFYYARQ